MATESEGRNRAEVVESAPIPRLRDDAEHNRERIVTAAQEVFAERGLDASLDEVARRAGVDTATIYRRFPTRTDLLTAIFERNISDYVDAVDEALANPSSWTGFCQLLERLCAMQAADAGLRDLIIMSFPKTTRTELLRATGQRGIEELVARAKIEGKLRPDFAVAEVASLFVANAYLVSATCATPDEWRRFVANMIESFRAERPIQTLPPPTDRRADGPIRAQRG